MRRILSVICISVALAQAGCIDLAVRSQINPDGSLVSQSDVAVSRSMIQSFNQLAQLGAARRDGTRAEPFDFAKACADGFRSTAIQDVLPLGRDGAVPTDGITLPKGVPSKRGDHLVCTFTETIGDPLARFAEAVRLSGLPAEQVRFERLAGGDGYRISASLRAATLMTGRKISEEEKLAIGIVAGLVPPEISLTVAFTGSRIGETNGALSADGRTVSWKIPIAQMFDMREDAAPINLAADIYFK